MLTCDQCRRWFIPGSYGGHRQRFCRPLCRQLWNAHLAKRRRQFRLLGTLIRQTPEPKRSVYVQQQQLVREAIDDLTRQQRPLQDALLGKPSDTE